MEDYVYCTQKPFLATRWWLKVREIKNNKSLPTGSAIHEFYVPWWAKPLNLLYSFIFGSSKIEV